MSVYSYTPPIFSSLKWGQTVTFTMTCSGASLYSETGPLGDTGYGSPYEIKYLNSSFEVIGFSKIKTSTIVKSTNYRAFTITIGDGYEEDEYYHGDDKKVAYLFINVYLYTSTGSGLGNSTIWGIDEKDFVVGAAVPYNKGYYKIEEPNIPVTYNGTQLTQIVFNGTPVTSVVFNGTKLY